MNLTSYRSTSTARGPAQYKYNPGKIMVSKCNHLLDHFQIAISISTAPIFRRQNTFEKVGQKKCSLNKLLNMNRGGKSPLVVHALLQLVIFMA